MARIEMRSAYKTSVGETEGKRWLVIPVSKCKYNNIMDLKEVG